MTKDAALATNGDRQDVTVRNAEIIGRIAHGEVQREIAADYNLSRQRIGQIKQENSDLIRQLKENLQLRALKQGEQRWDKMIGALCASTEDPQNKNQAQAARAFGELSGMTGKHQNVHLGDNHLDICVNLDARHVVIEETHEELEEQLRKLREQLG